MPHATMGATMSRLLATLLSSFVIMILASGHSSGAEPAAEKARTLRHVVLFKFKDTSTEADVAKIVAAFRGLPAKIKEIAGFEWGTGFYINPTPPEEATKYLREVVLT